jgi:hypothetical protein
MSMERIWNKIQDNIQETINIHWEAKDLQFNPQEQTIKDAWNLTIRLSVINEIMNQTPQSPDLWNPPPTSFIKLNFDGASKGNPGPVGGRGVFMNDRGEILYIYTLNLGYTTNNTTELSAMIEGLEIAIRKSYQKIILEGDLELIISIC